MRHTTFQAATFCNRTRRIMLTYTSGLQVSVLYGQLGIDENIVQVWIDKETKGKSLGIEMASGEVEYMPYDQPLALTGDSECQNQFRK